MTLESAFTACFPPLLIVRHGVCFSFSPAFRQFDRCLSPTRFANGHVPRSVPMATQTKTNDLSLFEQASSETEILDAVRVYLVKSGMDADEAQAMGETVVAQVDFGDATDARGRKVAAINAAIAFVRTSPSQHPTVPRAVPSSRPRSMRRAAPYAVARVLSPKAWLPLPGRVRVLARSRA